MKFFKTIITLIFVGVLFPFSIYSQNFEDLGFEVPKSYEFYVDSIGQDENGNNFTLLSSERFGLDGRMILQIFVSEVNNPVSDFNS